MKPSADALQPLVGDLRQIAGVRRIVLDDGAERGVRALSFSTGGGLDFWAIADRSLDIGMMWFRGVQLGWQTPAGNRSPTLSNADADGGRGFNRSFSGFLVTCGLDNVRQPTDGRPLHGHLPQTPARVTAYGEDWSGTPTLYCEGEMVQWRYGGEGFRVRRRIEAPVGGSTLRIRDEVENIGPAPAAPMILYHFNLGYPAIANGTVVRLDETVVAGPIALPDSAGPVPSTLQPSSRGGRSTCLVETPGDPEAYRISFSYSAQTLPWLQLWRDLRPRIGVLSIEPCNVGRNEAGANEPGAPLEPGEKTVFDVEISVTTIPSTADRETNHG